MDRRQTLNDHDQRRAAAWFGADLSDAAIHTGPAARRLCQSLGARGIAAEGQVFLRDATTACFADPVLRHELAHALQQRGTGRRGFAEAEAIARTHTPGPIRAAADPRDPAAWEEVGHYYTVYAVLLGSGVKDALAKRLAFYTQLADEMADLDAMNLLLEPDYTPRPVAHELAARIAQQERNGYADSFANLPVELNNGICTMLQAGRMWSGCYAARQVTVLPEPSRDFSIMLDVHKGLHSLTGELMERETAKRLAILRGIDPSADPFAFGLALHAFGDSYAHRDTPNHRMFGPGVGHGVESQASRFGIDGHVHVDGVGPTKRADYQAYVGQLYDLFATRCGPGDRDHTVQPRVMVLRRLVGIVSATDEQADTPAGCALQIAHIRNIALDWLPGGMSPWRPESHGLSTLDRSGVMRIGGPDMDVVTAAQLARALELARYWSQSTGAFTGSGALPGLPR
ncbi:DUF4157 domain-containing protein [Humitalea sp. 24SJ18S-53]|uniref:eCIS core domain-containing protein n=1 Tax=Humitalea sp. 24SJ18S-53 TaxID=3422307 RepID=UPI003D67BA88